MIKYYLSSLVALALLTNPAYAAESQQSGYQSINNKNQKAFRAYVAGPVESKQGLLLLHGWQGLNQEMEIWANQFAVQGYRVMAIDLYNNQVTKHPVKARKLMNSVKQQEANDKFRAAIKLLSQSGRKIAVLGRSFGANQAFYAASVSKKDISAVVLYYPFGDVVSSNNLLSSISVPVLGNFASKDFFFDNKQKNKFISLARKKGINLEVENYSARHGFSNLFSSNFNADAYKTSFNKTSKFLTKYLR